MRHRTASVVSLGEVEKYFAKFHAVKGDGESRFVSKNFTVRLTQEPVRYRVSVSATDDPSDSEEKVTDKPLDFVAEFAGIGSRTSGATPSEAVRDLRGVAAGLMSGRVGLRAAAATVRRLAARIRLSAPGDVPRMKPLRPMTAPEPPEGLGDEPDWRGRAGRPDESGPPSSSKGQAESQSEALEPVREDLRARGWKFHDDEGDAGLPSLVVDVAGAFEATVTVESAPWSFSFDVNHADASSSGRTEDPIAEFRKFCKSDEVARAKEALRAGPALEMDGPEPSRDEPSDRETARPAKKPAPPDGATVRPGKGP